MHEECYRENGGCAILGCQSRVEDWPRCSACEDVMKTMSAVVCINCGFHNVEGRYVGRGAVEGGLTPEQAQQVDWDLPSEDSKQAGRWLGMDDHYLGILVRLPIIIFGLMAIIAGNGFLASLFLLLVAIVLAVKLIEWGAGKIQP
jgi:hypothetical protein